MEKFRDLFYIIVDKFNLSENTKAEQLKEDPIVNNWLSCSKQSTRKTYLFAIKGFTECSEGFEDIWQDDGYDIFTMVSSISSLDLKL